MGDKGQGTGIPTRLENHRKRESVQQHQQEMQPLPGRKNTEQSCPTELKQLTNAPNLCQNADTRINLVWPASLASPNARYCRDCFTCPVSGISHYKCMYDQEHSLPRAPPRTSIVLNLSCHNVTPCLYRSTHSYKLSSTRSANC